MPTYVYECKKCGETMEVDQRIVEDPLTDCPCGGKGTLKRLIQRTAVMFKGSGFHINDYAPTASSDKSDKSDVTDKSDPPKPAETPKSDDTSSGDA